DLDHIAGQVSGENGAAQPENRVSSENSDRRTQQYAEGKRPAFIQSRKDQENEKEREREDDPGGYSLLRFFLLKGHAHIVVAHLSGHGLSEGLLQSSHGLTGAVAGGR